jgi:hypothetical protein
MYNIKNNQTKHRLAIGDWLGIKEADWLFVFGAQVLEQSTGQR